MKKIIQIIKEPLYKIIVSLTIDIFLIIYYIYLGISLHDLFSLSISIYYIIVSMVKVLVLVFLKLNKDDKYRKLYMILTIFMTIIDLSLIVPMFIMVFHPNDVNMGIIPSITVATYTTYKITVSLINLKKKKTGNKIIKFIRELSLLEAFVSVLMLQHTLIMVNGGMNSDMLILSTVSSAIIILFLFIYSIFNLIKTIKEK